MRYFDFPIARWLGSKSKSPKGQEVTTADFRLGPRNSNSAVSAILCCHAVAEPEIQNPDLKEGDIDTSQ